MLIFGTLLNIYDDTYKGKTQQVAQVLDKSASGRMDPQSITLADGTSNDLAASLGTDVVLAFTMILGRSDKGSYALRVDGKLPDATLLDNFQKAALALV